MLGPVSQLFGTFNTLDTHTLFEREGGVARHVGV